MSPPLPSACDGFAEAIVLRGDRELGPAESAALDAHLEACAACRGRARREEVLSSVLKQWDAETAQPVVPPARLAGAIYGQIHETARHRRAEERLYRGLRYAQAACVVLGLATAIVLGLGAEAPGGDAGGRPTALSLDPSPGPAVEVARLAPAAPEPPFPGRAAPPGAPPAAEPATPAVVVGAEALARAEARLVPVLARHLREQRFSERLGEPGVWVTMPDGVEVLLTLNAAAAVTEGDLFPRLERRATGRLYAPASRRLGGSVRRVAEVLPIPAAEQDLVAWLPRLAWETLPSPPLRVAEIPPATGPGLAEAAHGGPLLSAAEAVRAGVLAFEEGEHPGEVIALSKGNRAPIFLPAGEILVGGERDRVVSRSTWIPAATEGVEGPPGGAPAGATRRADLVPCVPVSTTRSRRGAEPAPLGVLAGPAVRSLLAGEARPERVLALVRAQLVLKGFRGDDLSLADLYAQPSVRSASEAADRTFPRALAGFAVVDVDGRLLGVETTSLGEREGARLLGRLLVGYVVEGQLRDILRAQAGAPSATASTTDVLPVLAALLAESRPLETVSDEAGVRVARWLSALDDLSVETVEVGGRTAFAAVLRSW